MGEKSDFSFLEHMKKFQRYIASYRVVPKTLLGVIVKAVKYLIGKNLVFNSLFEN